MTQSTTQTSTAHTGSAQPRTALTTGLLLIAAALLLLGPAAAHPNAGPVTDLLMWAALLGGLVTVVAGWARSRRIQFSVDAKVPGEPA